MAKEKNEGIADPDKTPEVTGEVPTVSEVVSETPEANDPDKTPETKPEMVKVRLGGIIRVIPKNKVDEFKSKGFVIYEE
jgi:hypothetical protein